MIPLGSSRDKCLVVSNFIEQVAYHDCGLRIHRIQITTSNRRSLSPSTIQ
jgi:hypothetical protein